MSPLALVARDECFHTAARADGTIGSATKRKSRDDAALTRSKQADRSRTRHRPDFSLVNAIARRLVTASLQCHARDHAGRAGPTIAFGFRRVNAENPQGRPCARPTLSPRGLHPGARSARPGSCILGTERQYRQLLRDARCSSDPEARPITTALLTKRERPRLPLDEVSASPISWRT
jgi:hypothetical protein